MDWVVWFCPDNIIYYTLYLSHKDEENLGFYALKNEVWIIRLVVDVESVKIRSVKWLNCVRCQVVSYKRRQRQQLISQVFWARQHHSRFLQYVLRSQPPAFMNTCLCCTYCVRDFDPPLSLVNRFVCFLRDRRRPDNNAYCAADGMWGKYD